jgi:MFS family permease
LRKLNPDDSDDFIQSILRDIQDDIQRERETLHQNDTGLGWLLKEKPRAIQKMLALGLGIAISHQICGIDAIQYYLVFILQACGITSRDAQAQFMIALGGLKLACLFVASALVDKLGRRPLFLISVTGMIVSLLTIAANFFISSSTDVAADTNTTTAAMINSLIGVAPTTSMIMTIGGLALYLASFSVGMGPLGWILPPELFSTTIRSKAVSLTTFANRMTATFMTSTMLSIANFLSWGGYFCFLASINVTIWFLAWWFLPETKGRKLEDMSAYFQEH